MPKQKLNPLPSAAFQILLALADEDLHGYGIMRDVEDVETVELRVTFWWPCPFVGMRQLHKSLNGYEGNSHCRNKDIDFRFDSSHVVFNLKIGPLDSLVSGDRSVIR